MFKAFANLLNRTGFSLSKKLGHKNSIHLIMAATALLLTGMGLIIGLSKFSPDSWAYFELSKTIFNSDFYRFNTFRSYYSNEYSTSFPFGYPIVIAVVSFFIGHTPIIAVAINIFLALVTCIILVDICKLQKISALAGFTIALSLLFFPAYLDEIFSGRSIPCAIFVFTLAYYLYLLRYPFFFGIFLGASALIRFDFLVYSILFQIIIIVLKPKQRRAWFTALAGFSIGVFPWIVYSLSHFGKLWISDNSWVASSALPAFVLDYPAIPSVSVFQNPLMWMTRIISNIGPLLRSFFEAAIRFPAFVIFFFMIISSWSSVEIKNIVLIIFFVSLASVAPYLLTGYFDSRYFSLIFICLTSTFVFALEKTKSQYLFGLNFFGSVFLSFILVILIAATYFSKAAWSSRYGVVSIARQFDQIKKLNYCHKLDPQIIYIFIKDAGGLAPIYGAITGMRAAFIPSNFDKMNNREKSSYFEHMQPYLLIDSISQEEKCTRQ